MLAIGIGVWMISIFIIGISILLIGLVLLQKNRGSGLSGAFGGVGGHSAFGTKTGDFLTWFTVALATLFLVLCIVGNFWFEPQTTAAPPPAIELPNAGTPATATPNAAPPAAGATGSGDAAGDAAPKVKLIETTNE